MTLSYNCVRTESLSLKNEYIWRKKKNLKSYQVTMRLSRYYIISHDRLWNNFVYKIKRKRYLILSYFNLAGNITFTFAKIFLTTQKNQTCKHEIISETFPHKRATLQTTTSDQERDKIDILIFFLLFSDEISLNLFWFLRHL